MHTLKANAPILYENYKHWPVISKDDRLLWGTSGFWLLSSVLYFFLFYLWFEAKTLILIFAGYSTGQRLRLPVDWLMFPWFTVFSVRPSNYTSRNVHIGHTTLMQLSPLPSLPLNTQQHWQKLILYWQIQNFISLYLTLGNTRKGYGNRNVTPYMHAAAYHLQDSLHKFDNVKQFSGQG